MDGYMGKILRVNLTSKECTEEPLNPKYARDYIGGTGLGNRIIYDEVPPSTDPLDLQVSELRHFRQRRAEEAP